MASSVLGSGNGASGHGSSGGRSSVSASASSGSSSSRSSGSGSRGSGSAGPDAPEPGAPDPGAEIQQGALPRTADQPLPPAAHQSRDLAPPPFAAVAEALGEVRRQAIRRSQPAQRAVRLPSAAALLEVIEGLRTALYPSHLGLAGAGTGPADQGDAETDEAVRSCLESSLKQLRDQVVVELRPHRPQQQTLSPDGVVREASALVAAFADQLPRIRAALDRDLEAAYSGDPAAGSLDEVMACYPGVKAITYHRFAHALHGLGVPVIARMIADAAHSATSIDIHPGARIGERFFIDHGTGVVIGGTAIIGNGVRLYQAVTLGAKSFPTDATGRLVKGRPRHPIVEDDVVIYAGATILGRVTIGRGSTIGGNVWLTESVPPGSTITQARARHEVFGVGGGGI